MQRGGILSPLQTTNAQTRDLNTSCDGEVGTSDGTEIMQRAENGLVRPRFYEFRFWKKFSTSCSLEHVVAVVHT